MFQQVITLKKLEDDLRVPDLENVGTQDVDKYPQYGKVVSSMWRYNFLNGILNKRSSCAVTARSESKPPYDLTQLYPVDEHWEAFRIVPVFELQISSGMIDYQLEVTEETESTEVSETGQDEAARATTHSSKKQPLNIMANTIARATVGLFAMMDTQHPRKIISDAQPWNDLKLDLEWEWFNVRAAQITHVGTDSQVAVQGLKNIWEGKPTPGGAAQMVRRAWEEKTQRGGLDVVVLRVKGHQGIEGNEKADRAAKIGALLQFQAEMVTEAGMRMEARAQ
ncbi:hypothetical protein BDZ91DRAFT_793986 [Kalaharituber pfeilii]|nr:hypothetical protein BDZ91DRAFT_793986 [Kalaharituber pfeilii]